MTTGMRVIHDFRGAGQVISTSESGMMVVLFDDNRVGTFAQESENFVYEETNARINPSERLPQKNKSARGTWQATGNYWPYEGHEEFFKSTNFVKSLETNPQECWWFFGYLQACAREERHEPVRSLDAGVQQRGATLHNYFPDPGVLGLDAKVGEFFDFYRKGLVQINSVSLYNFLGAEPNPSVPVEYQGSYQLGREAGLKAKI